MRTAPDAGESSGIGLFARLVRDCVPDLREWVSESVIHSFRFGDSYRISELCVSFQNPNSFSDSTKHSKFSFFKIDSMAIHLKSSIFKQLREAEVGVVLERVEGAAVRDTTYVHVRTLQVKTIFGEEKTHF